MQPKTLFFCKTCQENRYGEVVQQATTYGQSLVRVIVCATCNKTTIENLPKHLSENHHNRKHGDVENDQS